MKFQLGVRALAAQSLKRVIVDGISLRSILQEVSTKLQDARDRALLRALLFESTRWYLRLAAVLDQLLDKPLQRREPELYGLLIIGLAQLEYLQLAEYAAVAATVQAARELNRPHHTGLVNAVLRRFLRERDTLCASWDADPVTRFSHPRWLIDRLEADWPQQIDTLLASNNIAAPLWLRVNARRSSNETCAANLRSHGLAVRADAICRDALVLDVSTDITRLPGYAEGVFSVQDGAAQLAVDLLDVRPGLRVLDACAAPGGKTSHILERADVDLLALDREPTRLLRVEENLRRLGLNATLRVADAGVPSDWWDGQLFDRILLDAPCSATGIIRRQPDIKWHRLATDIDTLIAEQAHLLDALWALLRPGGYLVYATCSVLRGENEVQIARFLARVPDVDAHPVMAQWGLPAGAGRQNLPGQHDMDGFFYAVLRKKN